MAIPPKALLPKYNDDYAKPQFTPVLIDTFVLHKNRYQNAKYESCHPQF
jgi:hypothetical protein